MVGYPEEDVYCMGSTDLSTLEYIFPNETNIYNWHIPPQFNFKTSSDLYDSLQSANPTKRKGYLLLSKDACFYATYPLYLSMSSTSSCEAIGPLNTRFELDPKEIYDMILFNMLDDIFFYMPDYIPLIMPYYQEYNELKDQIEAVYMDIRDLTMENYAKEAKQYWFFRILFGLKTGEYASMEEYLGVNGYNLFIRNLKLYREASAV